jgi:ATP-dependent DNA helicase RecG
MERVLADAAICFANTAGGIIIVGVCDKKKGIEAITGTNLDPDRVKQRIYELSRPHLNVEVTRHPDHENLLLIFVPQSSDIHSDTRGRAYHPQASPHFCAWEVCLLDRAIQFWS